MNIEKMKYYDIEDLIRFWSMSQICGELNSLHQRVKDLEAELMAEREKRYEIFKASQETQMNWVMSLARGDLVLSERR